MSSHKGRMGPMQIHIRPYKQLDKKAVKRLVKLNFEEENLLQLLSSPNLRTAFVAVQTDEVVGAGFNWKSAYHPSCHYFRILIEPSASAADVASELLLALEETIDDDLPLQTSIWETNVLLAEFYKQNGFQLIRKTYMPELQISDISRWPQSDRCITGGNSVSLVDIAQDHQLVLELCTLVKKNYEQTHTDNQIANLNLMRWKELIFAEDIIMEGSLLLLDSKEKIVAYSLLHQSDKEERLELGWCGSVNTQWKKSLPFLIQEQIHFASKHGYKTLLGEFDTTSPYAMEVMAGLPFPPCAAWLTYQS